MSDFMAGLLGGGLKRLLVLVGGSLVLSFNKKFGLDLDVSEVVGLVAMVIAYIGQSAWRQGKDLKPELVPAIIEEAIQKALAEKAAKPV